MRYLFLLGKHRFGAAGAGSRSGRERRPAFMTWLPVVAVVAGAALCAVATLLL
jgi:hypothetical protein